MIFRLSQKLSSKIKVNTLADHPLHEQPICDWSANGFVAVRKHYILVTNTKSLCSTLMCGKGIADESAFVKQALSSIRELVATFDGHIAHFSDSILFGKSLNRSVTGSMNDMIRHATYMLLDGDLSLAEIATKLNRIPMSALGEKRSDYGYPRDVFAEMLKQAE